MNAYDCDIIIVDDLIHLVAVNMAGGWWVREGTKHVFK